MLTKKAADGASVAELAVLQFASSGKKARLKRLWFGGKKSDEQEHAEFVSKMKNELFVIPATPTGGRLRT